MESLVSSSSTTNPLFTTRTASSRARPSLSLSLKPRRPKLQVVFCASESMSVTYPDQKPKEAKLWGSRFEESVTDAVERFTESISFDKQLYKHDIMGSKAHTSMLAAQVAYNKAMEERQAKAQEEAVASNTAPTPIDLDVVWLETVGERHGRVYGMGNEVSIAKQKQFTTSSSQVHSSSTVSSPPRISAQEQQDLRYRVHELSTQVNVMQSSILSMRTDMKEILFESFKELKGQMSQSSKKPNSKKKKKRVDESPELSSDEGETHHE